MKNFAPRFVGLTITGLIALTQFVSAPSAPGGVRGLYKGISKNNVLTPKGFPEIRFQPSEIQLRLPNGKGNLRGTLLTSKLGPNTRNVAIRGRVAKCAVRQGGNRVILSGNWEWNFKPLGAKRKASGPFRFSIRKTGNTYRIRPPETVKVRAAGVRAYVFTSSVTAKK